MSNNGAPVCPISQSQPIPVQPGIIKPYVPKAVNLQTAVQAINVLNQMITNIMYPPPNNNVYMPPSGGVLVTNTLIKNSQKNNGIVMGIAAARFVMVKKTTDLVRYHNKNDPNMWVEIEEIRAVKWKDTIWGEVFQWER